MLSRYQNFKLPHLTLRQKEKKKSEAQIFFSFFKLPLCTHINTSIIMLIEINFAVLRCFRCLVGLHILYAAIIAFSIVFFFLFLHLQTQDSCSVAG